MPTSPFVFSDIEGSTRLWQAHPEEMKGALAVHDSLIADAISSHGGHIFKHTGDGVAAVFESARDAVVAATEIQRGLAETKPPKHRRTTRPHRDSHGEAEDRDGDLFGEVVSRTARLMSVRGSRLPGRFPSLTIPGSRDVALMLERRVRGLGLS